MTGLSYHTHTAQGTASQARIALVRKRFRTQDLTNHPRARIYTVNSLLHKPRNGPDRLRHRAPDQGFWNARGSRIGFVQQAVKR
jgi:hypothetical protein